MFLCSNCLCRPPRSIHFVCFVTGGTNQTFVIIKPKESQMWNRSWEFVSAVRRAPAGMLFDPVYRPWYSDSIDRFVKPKKKVYTSDTGDFSPSMSYHFASGEAGMPYTINMLNRNQSRFPIGVIVSEVSPDVLSHKLQELMGNQLGVSYVIDRAGNLVTPHSTRSSSSQ